MDSIGTDYTSYKDLVGKISIDFPGDLGTTDFESYIKSLNIDTNRYQPFGIEVYAIESQNVLKKAKVRVLAYDLRDNRSVVRIVDADTIENLLKHIWRLSIFLTEKGVDKSTLKLSKEIDKKGNEVP
jgi:hypothetical protein